MSLLTEENQCKWTIRSHQSVCGCLSKDCVTNSTFMNDTLCLYGCRISHVTCGPSVGHEARHIPLSASTLSFKVPQHDWHHHENPGHFQILFLGDNCSDRSFQTLYYQKALLGRYDYRLDLFFLSLFSGRGRVMHVKTCPKARRQRYCPDHGTGLWGMATPSQGKLQVLIAALPYSNLTECGSFQQVLQREIYIPHPVRAPKAKQAAW